MKKPDECAGCSLFHMSTGFAPIHGPGDSPLVVVGEALGADEVISSTPFVGAAGRKLNASLARLGMERDQLLVGNVVSCRPPDNRLVGTSYEHSAISHCWVHRQKLISPKHTTYLTLGVTATRVFLKELLGIDYSGKLENWHGYVISKDGRNPPYIIPTFHPSYLLQGQAKLTGVFLRDIKRAMEVASFGYQPDEVSLVEDPSPEWFSDWVSSLPEWCWLAVDIETALKVGEAEDNVEVPIGQITRINFSCTPEQGVTVPWDPRYLPSIRQALSLPCVKVFWNLDFDVPILEEHGFKVEGPLYDGMWAWHLLQSDLPKSLGFVAPFYSNLPPWKHLSSVNEAHYGAMDGVQQLRLMLGIAKDLQASGQWETFLNFVVRLDSLALRPMSKVGLRIDSQRMVEFQAKLKQHYSAVWEHIQTLVPEDLKPLIPKGGWKRFPKGYAPEQVIERDEPHEILVCTDCGEREVHFSHVCS